MWRSACIFVFLAACTPTSNTGAPAITSGDLGTSQGPQTGNDLGPADMECGGQEFMIDRVQPNVFLVIDRSGSMGDPIADGSTTSKWQDMNNALTTLVTQFDSQIRLGMSLFNSDGQCAAGKVDTALAPAQGQTILAEIAQTSPGGNTPTAATLDFIRQNGGVNDPSRQNVVVLATDGLPNCNDTDVTGKISALFNATPSVPTYVIGVGSDTASNPSLLNEWATAGHTARSGSTAYYQTNSASDLQSAFQTIAAGIVSCTFSLQTTPPDPSQLYVWLNGTQVPVDPTNGYVYTAGTPPTITLEGTTCDTLKSDGTQKVRVVYGCPSAPIQ